MSSPVSHSRTTHSIRLWFYCSSSVCDAKKLAPALFICRDLHLIGGESHMINFTVPLKNPPKDELNYLFVVYLKKIWHKVLLCGSGRSPRCWGWDLHQTEPEDWWVHPAGRLWMEHGWVGWSSLWVPHGPHQLPALHFPGLHPPTSKSMSLPHCGRCSAVVDSVSVWFSPPLTFTLSGFIKLQLCREFLFCFFYSQC